MAEHCWKCIDGWIFAFKATYHYMLLLTEEYWRHTMNRGSYMSDHACIIEFTKQVKENVICEALLIIL